MPCPVGLVVKNGSKILGRTSPGIPGPSSRTSITKCWASRVAAQPDVAARAGGLGGVHYQVRDDLLDAGAIDREQGRPGVDRRMQRHRELGELRLEAAGQLRKERAGLDRLAHGVARAGERQEIANDRARSARLLGDDAERLALVRAPLVRQEILGEQQDGGERIVQLMRHAGHELAERRETLGLPKRLLGLANSGDVFDVAVEVFDLSRRAAERVDPDADGDQFAVLPLPLLVRLGRRAVAVHSRRATADARRRLGTA